MRAVFLAAGEGSRMNGGGSGDHKALTGLLGISLIERGILAMREAGIETVTVVVGHAAERVRHALGDGSDLGVSIDYVSNPEWPKGNGTSVYAVRELVGKEPFIVAMADHWYDPNIAKLLVRKASSGASRLCVDHNIQSPYYPDEATRVQAGDSGNIVHVGKQLANYNALDCGLFVFTQDIFDALELRFARGEYELGAAVNELALKGRLDEIDIGDLRWEDVDTSEELKEASNKLRRSLPGDDDGLISANLNRRLSIPLSMGAIRIGLTPNMISLFSLLIAMSAGLAFALGHVVFAGIATQLTSIIDGSDGEVARARFMSSRRGGLIDSVFDRMADGFILGGAGYYLLTQSPQRWEYLAVLVAIAVAPMSMILKDRYHLATGRKWQSGFDDGLARLLLASRDGRLFVVFLGGVFDQIGPAILFLAITGSALLAWRLVLIWVRLDPARREYVPTPPAIVMTDSHASTEGSISGGD